MLPMELDQGVFLPRYENIYSEDIIPVASFTRKFAHMAGAAPAATCEDYVHTHIHIHTLTRIRVYIYISMMVVCADRVRMAARGSLIVIVSTSFCVYAPHSSQTIQLFFLAVPWCV